MSGKDELRRQFGTVWRMASSGLDTLREVVVRSSQSGRLRVDLALLARERRDLLAALGAELLALVERDAIELPASAALTVERLRDIDARIAADSGKAYDNASGAPRGYEPEAADYDDELDPDDDQYGDAPAIPGVASERRPR